MTLPVFPNPISLNQVNGELSLAGTTLISLNQANVRTLAGVPTPLSTISMNNLHGKSARAQIVVNLASSTANLDYVVNSILGYSFGNTDFILNINAGVYAYATGVGFPAVYIRGTASGDTVTINNSGYIIGAGGRGGDAGTTGEAGQVGVLFLLSGGVTTTINNAAGAYIAGGGGGGAGGNVGDGAGGGGAGGGAGGDIGGNAGGSGGVIGANGSNGAFSGSGRAGGGGGRVLPGSRTTPTTGQGFGGPAGGSGGGTSVGNVGGYGGGPGEAGQSVNTGGFFGDLGGGGGGGWGSAGGNVNTSLGVLIRSGGAAGAAINRQSATVTVNNSGTIYGAVL
jgi:hypothetical protein